MTIIDINSVTLLVTIIIIYILSFTVWAEFIESKWKETTWSMESR
jgi:hypothetical protein